MEQQWYQQIVGLLHLGVGLVWSERVSTCQGTYSIQAYNLRIVQIEQPELPNHEFTP